MFHVSDVMGILIRPSHPCSRRTTRRERSIWVCEAGFRVYMLSDLPLEHFQVGRYRDRSPIEGLHTL